MALPSSAARWPSSRRKRNWVRTSSKADELELVIGMADIKDPGASVFVYSIQILGPLRLPEAAAWKIVQQAAPEDSWIELRNGYVRHDLLYGLPDSDRSIILLNLLQYAKKVRISAETTVV